MSLLAIFLTFFALLLQRRHNYKSVMPIAHVAVGDYEDRLIVKLCNNGIGPLIVTRLIVSDGCEEKQGIISWMPQAPFGILWSTFVPDLDRRALLPGHEAVLIELIGEMRSEKFVEFRDHVRKVLSTLVVSVEYEDIYGRSMPGEKRDLKWFGRHFS